MYKFLTLAFIIAIFASCATSIKRNDPKPARDTTKTVPDNGTGTGIGTGAGTGTGTGTGSGNNTNSPYTVKLNIDTQVVKTAVSSDTLYLIYTEKADLIMDKVEYQNSSAVHFKEDFSKSILANFHFVTLNDQDKYVTDYADDNLNNVKLKTASTILIDGKEFTKLHLERVFIFSQKYKQNALAIEAQSEVLKANKDVITFSSYIFDKKNYDTTTVTTRLVYTKVN